MPSGILSPASRIEEALVCPYMTRFYRGALTIDGSSEAAAEAARD
jgi:hypothetical protein